MRGLVTMYQDEGWVVLKEDGALLDISKSRTDGLQEAIRHAIATGRELKVFGGTGAVIRAHTTIYVPPMVDTYIDLGAIVVEFSPLVLGDGFNFDTMIHSTWIHRGSVNYRGNNAAIHLNPRTPIEETRGVIDGDIQILRLRTYAGVNPVGLHLNAGAGIIRGMRIECRAIDGRTNERLVMSDGVRVSHPGAQQQFFGNTITCGRIRGAAGAGIRVGENDRPEGAGLISANRWYAHILPPSPAAAGVTTWAKQDYYELAISNELSEFSTAIYLAHGADSNTFIVYRNDAGAHPVLDECVMKNNKIIAQ